MSRLDTFDVIIVGSGPGGGTMAQALAPTGARILLVERGDFVAQEDENWSPDAVWRDFRYRTAERWINDLDGTGFRPNMHYCVGGNSKFWGSALFRLRREDFGELEHVDGVSPAWPIDYETLAPYYDVAERLYEVHGQHGIDPTEPPRGPFPNPPVPHAPRMAQIVDVLTREGLHPFPLPLGLREGCILCRTCNSFACRLHAKSEADVCCVRPAAARSNVTLWTRAYATRLLTDGRGSRVESVEIQRAGDTVRVHAPVIIVSCGAVNSAALLLRSATPRQPDGLANSSGLVGRNYMAHLATMMECVHVGWQVNDTDFQKTVALNDYYLPGARSRYPLGQIQSQGRVHPTMARYGGTHGQHWIPQFAWKMAVDRGVDWLVMSEDLPHPDNRVTLDGSGTIRLRYQPSNRWTHAQLIEETKRILRPAGMHKWFAVSFGIGNTTHQCGTLRFGTNPATSVLDPYCRTHDLDNLFVVDASFFPSSAAVNPALTIIAQALRVADHIAEKELRADLETAARSL